MALARVKAVFGPVLCRLNEKEQRKEWNHISTLGNIEELNRIASETAGLLTLYYREQIESIDPLQKIKGSNGLSDKISWWKQMYDVRPESAEEKAIVMVADYITAWIIDGLKPGKDQIISTESVSQQLWLHVAKSDPIDQGNLAKSSDVLEILSAGHQKISLKIKHTPGSGNTVRIQLRYLIGCASFVRDDGSIYQYRLTNDSSDKELEDLEVFGYVYASPFLSDEKTFRPIVDGRQLVLAKRDKHGTILTRFEDIIEYAQAYVNQNDQHVGGSSITKETAQQVAEVLRQQKIFVDSNDVREELGKVQETIELSVDVLREDIQEKAQFYQLSIDAAHEQIIQESEANRETMKKDNEVRYDQAWKKLNEQLKDMETGLKQLIEKRMNEIEKHMAEKTKEILKIAETGQHQSLQAIAQANQATEMSQQAMQQAKQAASSAQNLVQVGEQQHQEFQSGVKTYEAIVKQTAATQKEFYERSISEMRTKIELDFERAREAVQESAADAKASARAARESISNTQDVQKMTKNQLEIQKKEAEKTIADAKEARQQSERAFAEAREAEKQAKRAADASTAALDRVASMHEKVEKALERIEKLTKAKN